MPYARKAIITWQPGMYYHIYNRGAHQMTIFHNATNFLFTIRKIKEYSQANQISMIAYSLMPTHYHFLARQDGNQPAENLPQFVFNSYSKAYNNVKDGPVAEPGDWPYSNYLEWVRERLGTLVDRNFITEQFTNAEEYKKFLFEYLKTRCLPDEVQRHIYEIEK